MPQTNLNSRPVIDGQNEKYGNNQNENTNIKNKINRDQIKIILYNCNSAKHKMSTIRALVSKHKPNILSLNEVKMNDAEANDELHIPGYDCVRRLRDSKGGGVAIFIDDETKYEEIDLKDEQKANEIVGIKIVLEKTEAHIFNLYNPNKINTLLMANLEKKFKNILLMGDLNARIRPLSPSYNGNGKNLEMHLLSSKSIILNKQNMPTSYWRSNGVSSDATLDMFIGNDLFIQNLHSIKTLKNSPVSCWENDHFHVPVEAVFKIKCNKRIIQKSKNESFDYNKANWALFSTICENETKKAHFDNIDSTAEHIVTSIQKAANEAIPKKSFKSNRIIDLPPEIVKLFKIKNYWWRKSRKTKSTIAKENLNFYNSLIQSEIIKHESEKMLRFIKNLGPRPLSTVPMWRKITRLRNQRRSQEIPTLIVNNIEHETNQAKAEIFEEKMRNTWNDTSDNQFDNETKKKIDDEIESKKFEKTYKQKGFKKVTLRELDKQIAKLNNKTSLDGFGLSNFILKKIPKATREMLVTLINNCLEKGELPQKWKNSIVKMIPKKSDEKHNPNSYRPISLTPCIMRLFERVLLARLKKHLDENNILVKQQSGFREKRSTRDNLFFLAQKSFESFNKNSNNLSIFFDITAAFDKVWHNGLIHKLIKIKTPYYLVKITIAFLSGRKFQVKVGDYITKLNDITCGVPQGACLSPTYFSVYINDAPSRNSTIENTLIFADDLCYILAFKKRNVATENKIKHFLSELETWCKKWRLALAAQKCNYMIYSRKNKIDDEIDFNLKIDGHNIEEVEETKFLGLRLDPRMNFNIQVEYIRKTCTDRMSILKIVSHKSWHLDTKTKTQIYKSLIRSLIEYSAILYNTLNKKLKTILNTVQYNALRIIHGKDRSFSNKNLLKLAEIEPLEERMLKLKNNYVNTALKNKNPIVCEVVESYKKFNYYGRTIKNLKKITPMCDIAII